MASAEGAAWGCALLAVREAWATMSILFLDDSPVRTELFRTKYPEAVCVSTSCACIVRLQQRAYHLVCLDHDLVGLDTGMHVALWIRANTPRIRHIVIHSTNLGAALDMVFLLREAGYHVEYVPFQHGQGGPWSL